MLLMTKKYKHLQPEQRYQIECLLTAEHSITEIADILKVNKSTISREIKRNTNKRGQHAQIYIASKAESWTRERHRLKPKHIRFTEDMKAYARKGLKQEKLSPELIWANGKKEFGDFVSHETIYQWIWSGKKSNRRDRRGDKMLHRELKHFGRRRKRRNQNENRGLIKDRTSIDKRPAIINQRKRIGDKEVDLVLGKNRQPGLLIVTDRKLRMNWLEKITSKDAKYIERKLKKIINRCLHPVKSITFDNDLAFARHYKIKEDLKIPTYFTHPYTSQEKGTVENRIGVIRRFFPKRTDFSKVTAAEVREVERKINERPIRMFNYKSAKDLYEKMVVMRC